MAWLPWLLVPSIVLLAAVAVRARMKLTSANFLHAKLPTMAVLTANYSMLGVGLCKTCAASSPESGTADGSHRW